MIPSEGGRGKEGGRREREGEKGERERRGRQMGCTREQKWLEVGVKEESWTVQGWRYMNNLVHSVPQSKKEENREERKKNHTL